MDVTPSNGQIPLIHQRIYTDCISGILIAENQRTFADSYLESKDLFYHNHPCPLLSIGYFAQLALTKPVGQECGIRSLNFQNDTTYSDLTYPFVL